MAANGFHPQDGCSYFSGEMEFLDFPNIMKLEEEMYARDSLGFVNERQRGAEFKRSSKYRDTIEFMSGL